MQLTEGPVAPQVETIPVEIEDVHRSAKTRQRIATGMIGGGGAVAVVGLVFVALNRPESRKVVAVTPWNEGRGLSARVDF